MRHRVTPCLRSFGLWPYNFTGSQLRGSRAEGFWED